MVGASVAAGSVAFVAASGVVVVLVVDGSVLVALVVDGTVSAALVVDGSVVSVVLPVDEPVVLVVSVVFPAGGSVVSLVLPVDESVVLVELGGFGSPVLLGASDVVLLVVDGVPASGGSVGDVKLDTIAAAELRTCGMLTEMDSGGPEGTNMSVNSQTGLYAFRRI